MLKGQVTVQSHNHWRANTHSHIVVSLDPILLFVCAHNIKDNLQEDWWSDGLLSIPQSSLKTSLYRVSKKHVAKILSAVLEHQLFWAKVAQCGPK